MLLTAVEVQRELGISSTFFYKNFKPHLPAYKVGKKNFYRMTDVETFLNKNKTNNKNNDSDNNDKGV